MNDCQCRQTKSTGQMLFDEVCKRLDLQEKDYFSLSYLDDNQTRVSDRPPSLLCHDLCGLDELFCEQFVMEMLISVFPPN